MIDIGNELADLCDALGVDVAKVVRIEIDPHLATVRYLPTGDDVRFRTDEIPVSTGTGKVNPR